MKSIGALAVVTVALTTAPAWAQQAGATLDAATAGRFAALTLACVQKEYPSKITHVLNSPDDVTAPHELTPALILDFARGVDPALTAMVVANPPQTPDHQFWRVAADWNRDRQDGWQARAAGGHWLGSFATYLTTRRGIVPP